MIFLTWASRESVVIIALACCCRLAAIQVFVDSCFSPRQLGFHRTGDLQLPWPEVCEHSINVCESS